MNDLAAGEKIYSCDCWQVYCTTDMLNSEQMTAAGLGLSQCHFDDLVWDRTQRLTNRLRHARQPNHNKMHIGSPLAKSPKCETQKLRSAWLKVHIGVYSAANVTSELGLSTICWLATAPLDDALNTPVGLDELATG